MCPKQTFPTPPRTEKGGQRGKKAADTAMKTPVAAALDHLTGPARGTATWLSGAVLDVSLTDTRLIRATESDSEQPIDTVIARLHRSEETYEVEAFEVHPLWVNESAFQRSDWNHAI